MNGSSKQISCTRCGSQIILFEVESGEFARCMHCGLEIDTSEPPVAEVVSRENRVDADWTSMKTQLESNPRLSLLIESEFDVLESNEPEKGLRIDGLDLFEFLFEGGTDPDGDIPVGDVVQRKFRFKDIRAEIKGRVDKFDEKRWDRTIEALQSIEEISPVELFEYVYENELEREFIEQSLAWYMLHYDNGDLEQVVKSLSILLEHKPCPLGEAETDQTSSSENIDYSVFRS